MRAKMGAYCGIVCVMVSITAAGAGPLPGTREALAEIETGAVQATMCAADRRIGSRREISRFQILPNVWHQYSRSRLYQDPETAWSVAARILEDRARDFRTATGRDWDAVDLYIMWNAPGQYRRAKWDRSKVSRVVMERASRFANLMEARTQLAAVSR
jgi:hypothetical protein